MKRTKFMALYESTKKLELNEKFASSELTGLIKSLYTKRDALKKGQAAELERMQVKHPDRSIKDLEYTGDLSRFRDRLRTVERSIKDFKSYFDNEGRNYSTGALPMPSELTDDQIKRVEVDSLLANPKEFRELKKNYSTMIFVKDNTERYADEQEREQASADKYEKEGWKKQHNRAELTYGASYNDKEMVGIARFTPDTGKVTEVSSYIHKNSRGGLKNISIKAMLQEADYILCIGNELRDELGTEQRDLRQERAGFRSLAYHLEDYNVANSNRARYRDTIASMKNNNDKDQYAQYIKEIDLNIASLLEIVNTAIKEDAVPTYSAAIENMGRYINNARQAQSKLKDLISKDDVSKWDLEYSSDISALVQINDLVGRLNDTIEANRNTVTESSLSPLDRFEGLVNINSLKDFKEIVKSMTPDLISDGFDPDDIITILSGIVTECVNEVYTNEM